MTRFVNRALLLMTVASIAGAQPAKSGKPSPLQTGVALFEAEKLDQAREIFTPLAKGGDAEAMYYLGRIALDKSDGDAAVEWLEQAIARNDRSSSYHQWLGSAYAVKASTGGMMAQMSLAPAMKKAMERAVELDSSNVEARASLVQFYLQAPAMMGGGIDRAREQVAAIMKVDRYRGLLQDAAVAEFQKDTVAAERMLRDIVKAYPDSTTPVTRLATFYANQKRYDDAFKMLEDRLKKAPNDGSTLYQLGRVGAVSGLKGERAQWALNRYLKMPHKRGTPSIAAAHWRLGMVLEARGDKKTAKAEYETALALDPKLAGAKASLDKLK